jgi:hypothetical protein
MIKLTMEKDLERKNKEIEEYERRLREVLEREKEINRVVIE